MVAFACQRQLQGVLEGREVVVQRGRLQAAESLPHIPGGNVGQKVAIKMHIGHLAGDGALQIGAPTGRHRRFGREGIERPGNAVALAQPVERRDMPFLGARDAGEWRLLPEGFGHPAIEGPRRVFIIERDAHGLMQDGKRRRRLEGAAAQDGFVIVGHDVPPRTCIR